MICYAIAFVNTTRAVFSSTSNDVFYRCIKDVWRLGSSLSPNIHLYSPKTVEKKNNTKAIKSERKANNLTKQIKIC